MNATQCPSERVLSDYYAGRVSSSELDSISDHILDCPSCSKILSRIPGDTPFDGLLADTDQSLPPGDVVQRILDLEFLPAPLGTGERLRDYRLIEQIGEGGMGTVYRACHERLDKTVALKVIRHSSQLEPSSIARFEREMKAVGKLRHPNIVQATDAGECDGRLYLVMEFVEGSDLARLVKADGPMPAGRAIGIIRQAAAGLQHAHESGLIHRDLKPSNLMLSPDSGVKILDLGLAMFGQASDEIQSLDKAATIDDRAADLTSPSRALGTMNYMAPEQRSNAHAVDARADVYALGATLWFLLTGLPPHHGPSPTAIAGKVWQKLLADDPNERYTSAADFAVAIAPATTHRVRNLTMMILAAIVLVPLAVLAFNSMTAKQSGTVAEIPLLDDTTPKPGSLPMTESEAVKLQKAWADHLHREVLSKDAFGQTWLLIPPGTVTLGINFKVTITMPFEMGATELTMRQYREFVDSTGYKTVAESDGLGGTYVDFDAPTGQKFKNGPQLNWRTPGHGAIADDSPVTQVWYSDAKAYCDWLTAKTGVKHRLPTEAEWLWAYRAGDAGDPAMPYSSTPGGKRRAWVKDTVGKPLQPQPVGKLQPNPWGLHDFIGNVMEICDDEYAEYPSGSEVDFCRRGTNHHFYVIQGHCYFSVVCDIVNSRGRLESCDASVGFRVVRELPPVSRE